MRCLLRNQEPVYFALYAGVQEQQDADGNYTGEYAPRYSDVRLAYMNVSPSNGRSEASPFGDNVEYSKSIVTDKDDLGITTTSIMWIGLCELPCYDETMPYLPGDLCLHEGVIWECVSEVYGEAWDVSKWQKHPYNYEVKKVAVSKHYTSYAVKEVDVRV